MSKRKDTDCLLDVREAIRRIEGYVAQVAYEGFMSDIKTQDAVIRNLEVLGEATKQLSEELTADHPEIPWRSFTGVRDRFIHHYFGVNLDVVWQIATVELPSMVPLIERIMDERAGGG